MNIHVHSSKTSIVIAGKKYNWSITLIHSYSKDLLPFRGCKYKNSFIGFSYFVGFGNLFFFWAQTHSYPIEKVASALDSSRSLEFSLWKQKTMKNSSSHTQFSLVLMTTAPLHTLSQALTSGFSKQTLSMFLAHILSTLCLSVPDSECGGGGVNSPVSRTNYRP